MVIYLIKFGEHYEVVKILGDTIIELGGHFIIFLCMLG